MAKIIYLDFSKIDERILGYIKERRRRDRITADDAVTLLMVFEGVRLPEIPLTIVEPKERIDHSKVYSSFELRGNRLSLVFDKLEIGCNNYRIMNGEDLSADILRTELAKILVNFS